MKITPIRAMVWMWLLCSAWLPGIWWLQRLLAGSRGPALPAAAPVLGGGLLLLLLAALYLSLGLRIEQARLRMALRSALRGDATPEAAQEWRGLLDDVRLAMRRTGLERERLALRLQEAEDALREQGERSAQAARNAQDSLSQVRQEWRRLLPVLPSADEGQARLRGLQRGSQALEAARDEARHLEQGLSSAMGSLEQVRTAVQALGGQAEQEFLQRAARLAESLQLLSLNFRLALERLELIPGARGEALDTVVQDIEPLCAQATSLLQGLPKTPQATTQASVLLQPLELALQALPAELEKLLAAVQQGRAALEPLLPEAQAAATRDLRTVLEQALDGLDEEPREVAMER